MSIHVKWLLSMLYSATLQNALPAPAPGVLTLLPTKGRPATILAFTGFQYCAFCWSGVRSFAGPKPHVSGLMRPGSGMLSPGLGGGTLQGAVAGTGGLPVS